MRTARIIVVVVAILLLGGQAKTYANITTAYQKQVNTISTVRPRENGSGFGGIFTSRSDPSLEFTQARNNLTAATNRILITSGVIIVATSGLLFVLKDNMASE